ncbi:MAG TPA: hypothetical protein VGF26_13780, partial [Ramlibacter sp.]
MALLSPPAEAVALLLDGVELDMPELELPVEPDAPDDLVPELLDGELVDGELVLEPAVEPVEPVEPEVPLEVWAMATPMARVAASSMRVFFISEISCWIEVGSRGLPA